MRDDAEFHQAEAKKAFAARDALKVDVRERQALLERSVLLLFTRVEALTVKVEQLQQQLTQVPTV
jgi:hypothetical protein